MPLLGALAAGFASPLRALSPDLAISQFTLRTWQTGQGLPQNSVRALAQTPDGYLWIATQAGLARFDGVRFKIWRHTDRGHSDGDRTDRDVLPSDQVSALAVDREGALWIGTLGGLARHRNGKIQRIEPQLGTSLPQRQEDGEFAWRVRSLSASHTGHLCLGTAGQGILILDAVGQWRHYGEEQGVPALDFRAIAADESGGCWAGSLGGGLVHLEADSVSSVELPTEFVWSLYRGRNALWIGTDRGLFRHRDGKAEPAPFSGQLSRPRVGAILEDREGNLWIGTQGGGVDRWNGRQVDALHSPEGNSGPVIWSLFEDREGHIWFGSLGGGLSRLEEGPFVSFGVREGMASHQTHAVIEAPDGGLFVATNSGGIQHVAQDGSIHRYTQEDGLSSNTAWTLFVDRSRRLWIGTANRGVDRLDPDGTVTHFDRDDGLPSHRILAVLADRKGRLWVGSESGAAAFIETPDGDWRPWKDLDMTEFGAVTLLLESQQGRLWLATRDGLVSYDPNGEFNLLRPSAKGLPNAPIWSLAEGKEGRLWIGTFGGGLVSYDGERFSRFGTSDGLPSDDITAIVRDGLGYLWLASTNGLVRLPEDRLTRYLDGDGAKPNPRIFDRRDGMRSAESYGGLPIATRTTDGHLWFATLSGVVRVDPRAVADPRPPPEVLIESLVVDGRNLTSDAPLAPNPQEIRLRYTAATLNASQRIRFRYRLRGFSSAWSEVGERREAFFTNLAPGEYQFEVQASDELGEFHDDGPVAMRSLEIVPKFTETTTFGALAALALVLLGFGVQQARVWRLRRRQEELRLVAEEAAASVRTLRGLMPICASCKMIRDDAGYWNQLEDYIDQHSEARLSHGLCPSCLTESMEEAEHELETH